MAKLNDLVQQVLAQINQDEVIAFHQDLVRIPTVNPPGDVRQAIDKVAQTLENEGFSNEIVADLEHMPSLISRIGISSGPALLFNAHLDVVPTGEESAWSHDPFGAEIDNGRIYGRGAGDDKASVAAQVFAAIAVARSGIPLKGQLIVNEVSDEEVGGIHGTKVVVEHGIKPDWAIVGEQTLNKVALGEKGGAGATFKVYGRTAHGALPWEGANAIEAACEIVSAIRREFYPIIAERTHQYFKPSSGSINLFSGGVKGNVVPDYAEFAMDRRIIPGEDPQETLELLTDIANRAVEGWEGIRVEVILGALSRPASWTDPESPLAKAALEANASLGLSTEITGFSMATDGRYFTPIGVPTIIYGPGDPKLAHIPDEWVGIDEIMEATRFYAVAATRLIADYEQE